MTTAEAVDTSLNNNLSQDVTNLNDQLSPTRADPPGFKPFTLLHGKALKMPKNVRWKALVTSF